MNRDRGDGNREGSMLLSDVETHEEKTGKPLKGANSTHVPSPCGRAGAPRGASPRGPGAKGRDLLAKLVLYIWPDNIHPNGRINTDPSISLSISTQLDHQTIYF